MVYSENSQIGRNAFLVCTHQKFRIAHQLVLCDSIGGKKTTSLLVVVAFVSQLGGAAVPVHSRLQGVLPASC